MSDKWIEVGRGCEIDPDVVKNTLRYCADWDDSGPAIEIARKAITALQQREERIQRAIRHARTYIGWGDEVDFAVRKIIELLEGTDG